MGEAAPAIPYVDFDNLDPATQSRFDAIKDAMGFIPNSMRTWAHRPEIAQGLAGLQAIIHSPGDTLPASLKPKLGVICSSTNGCLYCTSHQCNIAENGRRNIEERWSLSMAEIEALANGSDTGATRLEELCFAFARAA